VALTAVITGTGAVTTIAADFTITVVVYNPIKDPDSSLVALKHLKWSTTRLAMTDLLWLLQTSLELVLHNSNELMAGKYHAKDIKPQSGQQHKNFSSFQKVSQVIFCVVISKIKALLLEISLILE